MKKFVWLSFCVLLVLALLPQPAAAQAEKGDKEVIFNAFVFHIKPDAGSWFSTGTVLGSLGYYFTNKWQGGGGANVSISGGAGTGTEVTFGFNGFVRYNFSTEGRKTVPYVGFDYFMFDADEPTNLSFFRPNAGVKYFFARNVALDFNGGYSRNFFADSTFGKLHAIDYRAGIAYVF